MKRCKKRIVTVPKNAKEWFSWRMEVGVEDEGVKREY
jgi:hypothetical protein